jgi:GntR family histidine utilization transcriptional repressor
MNLLDPLASGSPTTPRYQQLKAHILRNIQAGRLRPRDRVPSEQELVRRFGVSRMTAHRALRELASDGVLVRQGGVGTFVADAHGQSHALTVRNIADEIRERGHQHTAKVLVAEKAVVDRDIAERLRLRIGGPVYHSLILHFEDGAPVQAEDRYVSPRSAPDYLAQDFTRTTPNEYLSIVAPLQTVEHVIRAESPGRRIRGLLRLAPAEPALVVHRRTWSAGRPVSVAHLYYAGSRYALTAGEPPAERASAIRERKRGRGSP